MSCEILFVNVADCDVQSLQSAFIVGSVIFGLGFLVSLVILVVSKCSSDSKLAVAFCRGFASLGVLVLLVSSIIIIGKYGTKIGWAWVGLVVGLCSLVFLIYLIYLISKTKCCLRFVEKAATWRHANPPKSSGYRQDRFVLA
jgi:hypothetical protein